MISGSRQFRWRNHPQALIGGSILAFLYGCALFAGFLAPYPPDMEFREQFYHPPSNIHFRNEKGQFVFPYVIRTHLIDPRKHVFGEGSFIRLGFEIAEENRNPYIPEMLEPEEPFALIKNRQGETIANIVTAKETGENTGIFAGQTTIDPLHISSSFTVHRGSQTRTFHLRNDRYTPQSEENGILLLNESGAKIDQYNPIVQKFQIQIFVPAAPYKLFGLFSSRIHLYGTDPSGPLFILGTDQGGRDVLSRILHGARVSLTVGLIGVVLSTYLGLWIGGIAGYFGGKMDTLLMRSADVFLSIPALYLILSVRNVFPADLDPTFSYLLIIIVLSLTGWATMARVIRGMVLSLREQEFVLSARALGASSGRILLRHILPNTLGFVIVRATLLIPAYILAEVTLSYLGVGIQEPIASWGNMLTAAQELRVLEEFSWTLSPGVFLFLAVLGFNFLGDGLRDLQSAHEPGKRND